MSPIRTFGEKLTDDELWTATLLGLVSIPFTSALSWESLALVRAATSNDVVALGGSISGIPLVVAGLVAGYRYSERPTESRRAGVRTGLVGSIPLLALVVFNSAVSIRAESGGIAVAVVALTLVLGAVSGGLCVLIGWITARIGDWLATTVTQEREALESRGGIDRDSRDARWWRYVVVYALAAPIVSLFVVLETMHDSGVIIAVSVLGIVGLTLFALVALGALFIDATALRGVETAWRPNVWLYVGGPLAVYALTYLAATTQQLVNSSGYGTFGFLVGLWIASTVYLASRHRNVGTPSIGIVGTL